MKFDRLRLGLGAVVVGALTLTALASAHPSVYDVTGKVASSPEIQTITIDATGGTFEPSAGATAVAFDAPAYAVQAALGADAAIGRNATSGQANVLVTGADGGPYTLRFQGSLATMDVPQVVPDPSGLTGGASSTTVATTVGGGSPNITFTDDPTGASLPDDVPRAVIPNDGYVMTFVESNGLAENGWLNLRFMPGAYREPMTEPEWLNWPMAQTGIQSHATCQGAPGLNTEENILAVQSNDTDPFWNYVPWQNTSARLGDEPEQWIPVVLAAVGVDLSTLTTVDEFRTACEGAGGVYVPADSPAFPANNAIADAVEPLNEQIDALTNRPLDVDLQAQNQRNRVVAMVTGPLDQQVTVRLRISQALADRLRIPRTLDTAMRQFGAEGAALVTLVPSANAANRLSRLNRAVDVVVAANSGALDASAAGNLRVG